MSEDITLQAIALAEKMRECPETERLIMDSAERVLQFTPADNSFEARAKEAAKRSKYEKELFETASKAIGKPVTSVQVVNLAYMLLTPASPYDALGE